MKKTRIMEVMKATTEKTNQDLHFYVQVNPEYGIRNGKGLGSEQWIWVIEEGPLV